MHHIHRSIPTTSSVKSRGLAAYLRQVLLGGLLVSTGIGCQSVSTTTFHSVDQVEIGNAWKDSGMATQRMESSYREAWRMGYTDARQGKAKNHDQRKPAQFEAFQKHLRAESRQEWIRGYDDGYASAQQLRNQVDPFGHHQQLFETGSTPTLTGANENTAPEYDPRTRAPDSLPSDNFSPQYDAPNSSPTPNIPLPAVPTTPPAMTPDAEQPTKPPAKPAYIDQDHIADSWSTLNTAIERSVISNDLGRTETRRLPAPQLITNQSQGSLRAQGSIPAQAISYPTALDDNEVELPAIDTEQTFGLPQTDELEGNFEDNQPLPPLDLGLYDTTDNGNLKEQGVGFPTPTGKTNANDELELPEFEDQPISASQATGENQNRHVSSTIEAGNGTAHRSVSFDRKLELATSAIEQSELKSPQSPLVSARQLIRNQLPSRLPLRLKKR